MSLPTIKYCLLCEGVRPEPNGKATVLGFYGVLPFASVVMQEVGKGIAELMFLVGLSGPSDEFILRANIIAPDGSYLPGLEQARIKLPNIAANHSAVGGLGFMGIVFKSEGLYKIDFIINDTKQYQSSFMVRQGPLPS